MHRQFIGLKWIDLILTSGLVVTTTLMMLVIVRFVDFPPRLFYVLIVTVLIAYHFLGTRYGNSALLRFVAVAWGLWVLWIIPAVRETVLWAYDNAIGPAGMLYKGQGDKNPWQALVLFEKSFLGLQGISILTVTILVCAVGLWTRDVRRKYSNPDIVTFLLFLTFALIVLVAGVALTEGSDPRRGIIPLYLASVGFFVLPPMRNSLTVLRDSLVFCIAMAQGVLALSTALSWQSPILDRAAFFLGRGAPPYLAPDPDRRVFAYVQKMMSDGSSIAAMALALYDKPYRKFNTYALNVVSAERGKRYKFDTPFIFFNLKEGYDLLRDYDAILLDTNTTMQRYAELRNLNPQELLTDDLIQRLESGRLAEVGWKQCDFMPDTVPRIVLLQQIGAKGTIGSGCTRRASWSPWRVEARGSASSEETGFPARNLSDGSFEAWGSAEGVDNVYATVVLGQPVDVSGLNIILFSPGGHAHLRDFRVVGRTHQERVDNRPLRFLRARVGKDQPYREVLEAPNWPDKTVLAVQVAGDEGRNLEEVGIAVLRSSGDRPHWEWRGTGVYVRELQVVRKVAP